LITSLLPSTAEVLLNLEPGGYGTLEQRHCDYPLGRLGLETHLAQVRSFEKLTGAGMTYVETDLVQVLEETLPAHFAGSSADFQIVEQERPDGATRLLRLGSPRLGVIDLAAVHRLFRESLGHVSPSMAATWCQAEPVEVVRQEPLATRSGKVFPVPGRRRPPMNIEQSRRKATRCWRSRSRSSSSSNGLQQTPFGGRPD
jgi:hypothetical protein